VSAFDGVFGSLDISGSALSAQRFRMEVVTKNLAFADVDSLNETGQPYRARMVSFEAVLDRARRDAAVPFRGVRAVVRRDDRPGEPAEAPPGFENHIGVRDGRIEKSNVDVHTEMIQLLEASRSYEANIAAVKAFREMVQRALTIGK
jgi:flagellar basal-body rod protein FlgC